MLEATIVSVRRQSRGNLADHLVRRRRRPVVGLFQTKERPAQPARIGSPARHVCITLAAVALIGGLCAGCASSGNSTFAGRFVIPGTPAVDLGGPVPTTAKSVPRTTARAPSQPLRLVARSSAGLATLEATSPRLREQLAALGATPSVDGYLAVASTYLGHGVDDRAFDYLMSGLVRYPRASALHDAVARMWRDWNLPDRALRHAYLAVRYAPASAPAHNTLGTVLWALSAREAAARAFADAVALDADAAYAAENVCHAEAALGHRVSASCTAQRHPEPPPPPPLP